MSKPVSIATFVSNKERFEALQKFLNENGCENEHPWIEPENLPLNDQEAITAFLMTNSSNMQMPQILIIEEEILANLTGEHLRRRLIELVPKLKAHVPTIFLSQYSATFQNDVEAYVQWEDGALLSDAVKKALKGAIEDLVLF